MYFEVFPSHVGALTSSGALLRHSPPRATLVLSAAELDFADLFNLARARFLAPGARLHQSCEPGGKKNFLFFSSLLLILLRNNHKSQISNTRVNFSIYAPRYAFLIFSILLRVSIFFTFSISPHGVCGVESLNSPKVYQITG